MDGEVEVENAVGPGFIGRIAHISKDGFHLHIEKRDGAYHKVTTGQPSPFGVGQVVLVTNESIQIAPDELWQEETLIGTIKLVLDDLVLVDCNSQLTTIPRRDDPPVFVGNTVEFRLNDGVIRILADRPIKLFEITDSEALDIDKFLVKPDNLRETFDDVGGLVEVVDRARELIEIPLRRSAELREIGVRPIKGVLFTGAPGTGKTLLARVIARSAEAAFYEISGPVIFSKWFGQSEEVLRRIFDHASKQPRALIFFDEIDSVAVQRADDSHEASKRVVAQLLTLMDGFASDSNTVVIAATNRPQDLDTALRRPGRFDWEIEFPMPDASAREAVLAASSRGLKKDGDLSWSWAISRTEGWSSAELSAIWTEAGLLAVSDGRTSIAAEDFVGGFERVESARHRQLCTQSGNPS